MSEVVIRRITLHTLLFGSVLGLVSLLAFGAWRGLSVLVALGIVLANWLALRWIVGRVTRGDLRYQRGVMMLLVGKMGGLFGLSYLLLRHQVVEPIGFLMGVGVLVVACISGSLSGSPGSLAARRADLSDGLAARR